MNKVSYKVLGLMSGTSLDGLDIAYCNILRNNDQWRYVIENTITIAYPDVLINELSSVTQLKASELVKLDHNLGKWMGKEVDQFVKDNQLDVHFIASHGHTVFHQPEMGYTLQIGNATDIHQSTGLPVIYDFRSLDVANGGQGAPLVPVGDMLLFAEYDACLNLGGIANISSQTNEKRIAYDICPANMMLNYLASKKGLTYDAEGSIAREGNINDKLLNELNGLAYYSLPYPKSLGYEWFSHQVLPLIDIEEIALEDRMATCVEHVAKQIAASAPPEKMLITGGGAFNNYLIEKIEEYTGPEVQLVIPDNTVINYKEALIFALLGVLRLENKINAMRSVTGAAKDTCGGSIIGNISLKG